MEIGSCTSVDRSYVYRLFQHVFHTTLIAEPAENLAVAGWSWLKQIIATRDPGCNGRLIYFERLTRVIVSEFAVLSPLVFDQDFTFLSFRG